MKTNYVLFAALGALALTATSCINHDYDTDKTEVAVEVEVDEEPVVVPSNDLLDIKANDVVKSDDQGNLQIAIASSNTASVTTSLSEGIPTSIPGELQMTAAQDDIPDFCSSESGAILPYACILVELNNTSPEKVVFNGDIKAGGKLGKLPDLVVPAETTGYKIGLISTKEAKEYLNEPNVSEYIVVEDNVAEVINHISKDEGLVIKDMTVKPMQTRAVAPAAAEYEFSIGAKFCAPLCFPAGSELKFDIDFSGEILDVSEYNVTVNDYQIVADVTNTIPFDIDGTGTSTNGVTASLDKPIKAGEINKPTNTKVLIHIKSTANVTKLEGAVLHLVLKTDKNVRINKNQKLDIDMQSIKFSQKKK